MPFGEPSIPNNFIAEALHKHERRLNDLERQQYRVYYDPLNVTGDGVGRTVVEGNLLPVCGIDAFGVAIFDDSTATWRQVQGGATLPDVRSTVVGSAALNGSEFVRIDTGTFVAGSYARVIAPATPTRPGHPPPWGASIVAGANPLVFECSSNVVLALSSFPAYGDATVHLVSAAGLGTTGDVFISPTAGSIAIVTYTGISGNDLTGCTWIGPSAGWAGPAMAIHTSTQRFDTVTGPQHILVSGVNSGIFFEYEPVHNVWVRVADLSGSGGGSGVASVTAGDANIYVDNTDPLNPVVYLGNAIEVFTTLQVDATSYLIGAVTLHQQLIVNDTLGADSHINGGLHVAGLIYVDGDITQGTAGTYSQFRQMQIIDGGLVVEAGGIEINLGDLFVDGYANSAPDNRFFPPAYPTAHAPTYAVGAMYYDTTLNKLRIGGASAWETVTSV